MTRHPFAPSPQLCVWVLGAICDAVAAQRTRSFGVAGDLSSPFLNEVAAANCHDVEWENPRGCLERKTYEMEGSQAPGAGLLEVTLFIYRLFEVTPETHIDWSKWSAPVST
jgi:hypothetical protein